MGFGELPAPCEQVEPLALLGGEVGVFEVIFGSGFCSPSWLLLCAACIGSIFPGGRF